MKLRAIALTAALLAFALAPFTYGADKDKTSDQTAPTAAPPAASTVEPSGKVPHDGGADDIDAIGNRNVGCAKGMGNWYSLEKQIALGKQISQQVESQSKVINDPVVSEYINRLGQNLVPQILWLEEVRVSRVSPDLPVRRGFHEWLLRSLTGR